MTETTLVMGAVAYDPKVVTIWEGFRHWLRDEGLPFDFVLYSNYERMVEELVARRLDAAWNSPLAWVRAARLAPGHGVAVRPLVMRDTDCDLTSVVVVLDDAPARRLEDLAGKVVAVGAVDSPQATLLPLDLLAQSGLVPGADVEVRRFDIGVGLHGDHIGGEREAARALARREVDAACMIDANRVAFTREGTLPSGGTRVLGQTVPYDHCTMTVTDAAPADLVERFGALLLAMDYGDPEVRPLLDLEGLTRWVPGRTSGYAPLEAAVERSGFYDRSGGIAVADYRP